MNQILILLSVVTILSVLFGIGFTIFLYLWLYFIDKQDGIPCKEPDYGIDRICFNCGVHESEHNIKY